MLAACGNNCGSNPNYADASCSNYVNPNAYGNNYGGATPYGGGGGTPYMQQPYGGGGGYNTGYPNNSGYPTTGYPNTGYPGGGGNQVPICSATSGPNCRRY